MSKMIENYIQKCRDCQKYQKSNCKEPILHHDIPKLPFHKIALDIGEYACKNYLIVVDYLSKWLDIISVKNKTIDEIILKVKVLFSTHGIPRYIVCDNNPFNSYKFKKFAQDYNFDIVHSSPYHHQSNGLCEKGVGIAKSIIKKAKSEDDIYNALLEYRVTPVANISYSPSEILMSRLLRSRIPTVKNHLKPKLVYKQAHAELVIKNKNIDYYYNRNTKKKKSFKKGENVVIQNPITKNWESGQVIQPNETPRSYKVRNKNDRIIDRNSIFIRKSKNQPEIEGEPIDVELEEQNEKEETNMPPITNSNIRTTRAGRVVKIPAKYKDYI